MLKKYEVKSKANREWTLINANATLLCVTRLTTTCDSAQQQSRCYLLAAGKKKMVAIGYC